MLRPDSIFISYRRSDSQLATERMGDRLTSHFGQEVVFQDVESIPYGVDFTTHLEQTVRHAQIVVVVIGSTWLEVLSQRSQSSNKDWVRAEIETALALKINIIPVLVNGAQMPTAEALPESIRPFAYINAASVRGNPDFHRDMSRLISRMKALIDDKPSNSSGDKNSPNAEQYLDVTTSRLKQKGSIGLRRNITHGDLQCSRVLKILDFEPGLGMRGEALFVFSEFEQMNWRNVQQFSARALEWARNDVNPKAAGQAFFNVRIPTHLCFAVAVVDRLDETTRSAIATTNPIKHRADLLWYEVPVVYEVATNRTHYYKEAASFFENFRGEIVWKKLRAIIEELLTFSGEPDSAVVNTFTTQQRLSNIK